MDFRLPLGALAAEACGLVDGRGVRGPRVGDRDATMRRRGRTKEISAFAASWAIQGDCFLEASTFRRVSWPPSTTMLGEERRMTAKRLEPGPTPPPLLAVQRKARLDSPRPSWRCGPACCGASRPGDGGTRRRRAWGRMNPSWTGVGDESATATGEGEVGTVAGGAGEDAASSCSRGRGETRCDRRDGRWDDGCCGDLGRRRGVPGDDGPRRRS